MRVRTLHMQCVCSAAVACPVGHLTGVPPRITERSRRDCVGGICCGWYDDTIEAPLVHKGSSARGRTCQRGSGAQLHCV